MVRAQDERPSAGATAWDCLQPASLRSVSASFFRALGMKPDTPERAALGDVLTSLREHRLLLCEYDSMFDREATLYLTDAGLKSGESR